MKRKTKIIAATLLAVLAFTILLDSVSAQGSGHTRTPPREPPMQHRDERGNVFITTDIMVIMANNEFPMLHFWFAGDENGTTAKFSATYLMISEFEDANDDGVMQSDERLYFASLSAYEWTVQVGSIKDQSGQTTELWLKYIKGGLKAAGGNWGMPPVLNPEASSVQRFESVTIQIWAHIYLNDYTGNISDNNGVQASYLVPGSSELKMDIEIGNFPFSSNDTMVAMSLLLRENEAAGPHHRNNHRFKTRERTRNVTGCSEMNWNTEGANESRFERLNETNVQRIDFVDTVSGIAQGYFSWVDQATIYWPGGGIETATISASYAPVGFGLAVHLVYPNFDEGMLVHDPSVGLYEDAAPSSLIPLETALLAGIGFIAIVAVVVLFLRRR